MQERFWEIDFVRGAAIILMVASNLVTDLDFFGAYKTAQGDFWWFFARLVASLFVFLVGISLAVSYSKAKKILPEKKLFEKYLNRGLKIFCLGLAITLFTMLFLRSGFVVFGILHFIGFSIILAFPFLKRGGKENFFAGIIFIAIGFLLQPLRFDFPWLLWLGFIPTNFYTVDYFPLFPWFGVALLGLFSGNRLYNGSVRRFKLHNFSRFFFARLFCFFGRHSLLIYLIHQPIIISALCLFGIIHPGFLA